MDTYIFIPGSLCAYGENFRPGYRAFASLHDLFCFEHEWYGAPLIQENYSDEQNSTAFANVLTSQDVKTGGKAILRIRLEK